MADIVDKVQHRTSPLNLGDQLFETLLKGGVSRELSEGIREILENAGYSAFRLSPALHDVEIDENLLQRLDQCSSDVAATCTSRASIEQFCWEKTVRRQIIGVV